MAMGNDIEISEAEVEDLAWLVKDNLSAKHLLLYVEDLFVDYLECQSSEEELLALDPMAPYHRMLVHRLADLFGLAHESYGEGDDRHLVVAKCQDSSIPAILVSDALNAGDWGTQDPPFPRQLLKRSTHLPDGCQSPSSKNPTLSLEEREAAYSAARQRIFAESWKCSEQNSSKAVSGRPKSDPVVARRMIAHALGEPKLLTSMSPSSQMPGEELELQTMCGKVGEKNLSEKAVNLKKNHCGESNKSMQQSSAKAAKRMFANALGLPPSDTSPRVGQQAVSCRKGGTCTTSFQSKENSTSEVISSKCQDGRGNLKNSGDVDHDGCTRTSAKRSTLRAVSVTRHTRPGGAACRIFAQALGLPDPVSSKVRLPRSPTLPLD